ncbi:hypothetical protein VP01_3212g1 [Puccinia sorghi]|uniref:Uncharacterized protein n=1 Tax=Puccinia sorghi TaxID=27349 RepID=A0A0L6UZ66_9BASI|nr:hypothetical protein VP01_3212g1 [Puccinia sorghi]
MWWHCSYIARRLFPLATPDPNFELGLRRKKKAKRRNNRRKRDVLLVFGCTFSLCFLTEVFHLVSMHHFASVNLKTWVALYTRRSRRGRLCQNQNPRRECVDGRRLVSRTEAGLRSNFSVLIQTLGLGQCPMRANSTAKKLAQLPAVNIQESEVLMHSHCADCTATVPKIYICKHVEFGWQLGWSMLHANCRQLSNLFLQHRSQETYKHGNISVRSACMETATNRPHEEIDNEKIGNQPGHMLRYHRKACVFCVFFLHANFSFPPKIVFSPLFSTGVACVGRIAEHHFPPHAQTHPIGQHNCQCRNWEINQWRIVSFFLLFKPQLIDFTNVNL